MKSLTIGSMLAFAAVTSASAGGPLDGISRNLDKNGAFTETGFGATSKSAGEPGDVSISRSAIGIDTARGGEFASDNSVVTTTIDTGGETGTRVALPD